MLETGTTLQQRYRIDKQIGQGGMGAVYVATDARFESIVAIKETLAMDDNFRKAIEREARLLNSLKHPALPRVSDHFLERNSQFLVMEFVQGEDLCRMLDEQGHAFSVAQVLKWADQLLDALDYLHNQSIPVVHRDIKPQNLKLTASGHIVLLDFGLAKGNPTDGGHQTAAKSIFGYSRNYASLEQIQGTGTDPRSDLYSLAATLYHLMTNTAPEDALTRAMAVLSQKPDPLLPANFVEPKVPAGVAGVLQKALDLNASERPSTAAEMKLMLQESEKYAELTAVAPVGAIRNGNNVFTQPTRLMADDTRAAEMAHTDVRTKVAPPEPSGPRRRRFAVAAGAFIALLVGCGIAGGLYMMDPSLFTPNQAADNIVAPLPAANTVANTSMSDNSNVGSVQTNTEAAPTANAEAATAVGNTHSPIKSADTIKNGKPAPKADQTDDSGADARVDMAGDPDNPEEVTITTRHQNGKVTTTKIKPNIPPMNVPIPPTTGFDPFPQGATPEQLRQLQQLKRYKMMHPTPQPQQSPE
jgi:serine/threonine protein kinase